MSIRYTITKEEVVPFLNPDNTVMQMKNFAITISVEWDTIEETTAQADRLFDQERNKLFLLIPSLKAKEKKIQFILNALKHYLPDKRDQILEEMKLIK